MGAGASIPKTEADALDQGYTREEIDEYMTNNPEARRSSLDIRKSKQKSRRHQANYGIEEKEDRGQGQTEQNFMDQVNANYLIYDECQGDWDRIAERIPYTIAQKMERYVSEQLGTRTEMASRNKRSVGNGKEQEEDEAPMGDKELEKQRRSLFAKGQEEGLFY
jgi:hypothetical protein